MGGSNTRKGVGGNLFRAFAPNFEELSSEKRETRGRAKRRYMDGAGEVWKFPGAADIAPFFG